MKRKIDLESLPLKGWKKEATIDYGGWFLLEDYGESWKAYRRPLEREDGEA